MRTPQRDRPRAGRSKKVEQLFVRFDDKPEITETARGAFRETTYRAGGALFFLKPSGRHWQRFFMSAGNVHFGEYAAHDETMLHDLEEFPTHPAGPSWR